VRGLPHQTRSDRRASRAVSNPSTALGTIAGRSFGWAAGARGFAAATPSASVASAMQEKKTARNLMHLQGAGPPQLAPSPCHSLADVADLPRLPPRVEHRILRFACGLPPWLQRLAVGGPPRVDGQELAPDIAMLLRLAELAGTGSVTQGRDPAQARALNRAGTAAAAGPPRPMARASELEMPGPGGTIRARLYRAPAGALGDGPSGRPGSRDDPAAPLVVYFHGGGWVIGDLDTQDGVCRFLAANTGARVLSVDYRLAPEHPFPAAIEDAFAAFRWAAEQTADRARIAVAGDSAGGNLAAAVSLLAREGGGARPRMQALIYPATDVTGTGAQASRRRFAEDFLLTAGDIDWFERHYLPDDGSRRDPRVSVLQAGDLSGLPPAYVATAGFDPLRDEGEAYAQRMRDAGVAVALRRHPGLVHGFANLTAVSRTSRAAMHEVAGALRMGLAA
jgi:acetyl esterase